VGGITLVTHILLLLFLETTVRCDFLSSCPALCRCRWMSGKMTADCSSQGLTAFPPNLHRDIQVLIMDGNYIRQLASDSLTSAGLTHLEGLSMRDCHLTQIAEDSFARLTDLTELKLDRNNLTWLPNKMLAGSPRLEQVSITGNRVERLQAYVFPPLLSLKVLRLSENGIESVDRKAFMNLGTSLEQLDLSGNSLKLIEEETFRPLYGLQQLHIDGNPWECDCHLKKFRDFIVQRELSPSPPSCSEPERLAGKTWSLVDSEEFACKPEVVVPHSYVVARPGWNATLQCRISGNPSPAVKWVLNGRIISNLSSPPHASSPLERLYSIREVATAAGGTARNSSLTITRVGIEDLGSYSCVALNRGGMAESRVELTFSDPGAGAASRRQLMLLVGAGAAATLLCTALILLFCFCRRPRPAKNPVASSNPGYREPQRDRLVHCAKAGLPRSTSLGKQDEGPSLAELAEFGYVPAERYLDTSKQANCHGSPSQYPPPPPDQFPDLLDIPDRHRQCSPTSTTTTSTLAEPQPLHPGHLTSPLLPPFPYQSAPSSFTSYSPQFCCSALSYTTLPRRPAAAPCWSPREGGGPYDGPGPRTPRDGGPYDGVGPRTSVRGDLPPPPHRGEVGHAAAPSHSSPPASLGSETLSSYCEPWGQASLPAGRGSLASQESLSPLLPGEQHQRPRPTPTPPRLQGQLATIPEGPRHAQTLGRPPRNRPPPPTLPKPRPQTSLPPPAPPPESWQDETGEGSEV